MIVTLISLFSLKFVNKHNKIDSLENGEMTLSFGSIDKPWKRDLSGISFFETNVVLHGKCVISTCRKRIRENVEAMIDMCFSKSTKNAELDSFSKIQSVVMR